MTLFRLKLRPTAPWRTPWQADTLAGMLMAACARVHGAEFLNELIIGPMLEGAPPFVVSDACPGDLLPFPAWLRLARWPVDIERKQLKRACWLPPAEFQKARAGELPDPSALLAENDAFIQTVRQHNTLDRITDTTGEAESGLGIFNLSETHLRPAPKEARQEAAYLSVYYRILTDGYHEILLDLFEELSLTGFGADSAIGRGHFDLPESPEAVPALDEAPVNANAVISFSTFQPAPHDPGHGLWEAFPKFPKVGPDFGLDDVRKNTLILFRPGACFLAANGGQRDFLGRAIPMDEVLPPKSAAALAQQNVRIVHPAFALTVPAAFDAELLG